MRRSRLVVNTKSASAVTAIVLLLLSVLFVLIGKRHILLPLSFSNMEMIKYFALPAAAALLFILCIVLLGRKAFEVSVLPVFIAAVSTMIKGFEMSNIVGYGELLISIVLIVVYCCTMFGAIRKRFVFVAVTILLIVYHCYFVVYTEISTSFYTFTQLSYEIGIIFMYCAFIFALCGATRHRNIDPNTATTVVPPIPGGKGLAENRNFAVSAPEPEQTENKIPAYENAHETPAAENVKTEEKSTQIHEAEKPEDINSTETEIPQAHTTENIDVTATEENPSKSIKSKFSKIMRKKKTDVQTNNTQKTKEE